MEIIARVMEYFFRHFLLLRSSYLWLVNIEEEPSWLPLPGNTNNREGTFWYDKYQIIF